MKYPVILATVALLAIPRSSTPAEALTPETICARVNQQFHSLSDYECVAEGEAKLGGKRETSAYRVWFKKPRLLRVKVLRGRQKGSEVAVDASGQIRGRKSGILKPFVVKLKESDRRVQNLRGVPVTDFDWSSFYRRYCERASRPGARSVVTPRVDPQSPYELVLTYAQDGHSMREVYRIDPRLWLLVEGTVYEEGEVVDHLVFKDFKLNTGIEERWFRL